MGIVILIIFLAIIPIIIGLGAAKLISLNKSEIWIAALPMGFFISLAFFTILAFPWSIFNLSFSSLSIVFIFVLLILCIFSVMLIRKSHGIVIRKPIFSVWEYIYGTVALILICWQIYNMIHLDIGYWSSDDNFYGTVANDTLIHNTILRHQVKTGIASIFNIQRSMQASLIYPAFLSFVSGISVASVFHTALGVFYLVLAYNVYFFLGKVLFKTYENVFVFLIVLSALYIFGLYTIYSQTYRLLGPSTQGKAVLAVSFFPFLYTLIILKIPKNYDRKFGLVLLLLSITATSMTLFGTITMIGNVVFPITISLIGKQRNWRNVKYIAWGCLMPIIYCCIFFCSRLMP